MSKNNRHRQRGSGTVSFCKKTGLYRALAPADYSRTDKIIPPKHLGYFTTELEAEKAILIYQDKFDELDVLIENNITFKELYEKWTESDEYEDLSEKTKKNYSSQFNKLHSLYDLKAYEITRKIVRKVINEDYGHQKYETRNMMKSVVSSIYQYAVSELDYEFTNPTNDLKIRMTKAEKTEQEYKPKKLIPKKDIDFLWDLYDKEANKDLYSSETKLLRYYIGLMGTGMRRGELCNVKLDDVNFEQHYIVGGSKTKAGKRRIIPLHPLIEPLIKIMYENSTDKKHLLEFKSGTDNGNNIGNNLRNYFEKIGIKKYTPHFARHTFNSLMETYEIPEKEMKLIMGHSGDLNQNIYTHGFIDDLYQRVCKVKLRYF